MESWQSWYDNHMTLEEYMIGVEKLHSEYPEMAAEENALRVRCQAMFSMRLAKRKAIQAVDEECISLIANGLSNSGMSRESIKLLVSRLVKYGERNVYLRIVEDFEPALKAAFGDDWDSVMACEGKVAV